MTLTTDLAIRKWKPTKDGEAIGTGGRSGLYVRGWKTGAKAFYFRAKTWIKMGDYPDVSLATARELSTVTKRLARDGFGVESLRRGFANAEAAPELEAVIRGEVLAGLADTGATNAPTNNDSGLSGTRHEKTICKKAQADDAQRRSICTISSRCWEIGQ